MGRLLRAYERHLWGPLCRRYTTNHHRPEEATVSVRTVDELEAILVARNAENAALRTEVRTLKAEQRQALEQLWDARRRAGDFDGPAVVVAAPPSGDYECCASGSCEVCRGGRL